MPSQRCDIKGQSFGMVSDCHSNLYLLVHMRKELAIDIIDSEWVPLSSDQVVFLYSSRVNEVSHGTRVDHGCRLNSIRQCNWCSQMSYKLVWSCSGNGNYIFRGHFYMTF